MPQYEGNLQIQSDCRSIEVKLVLNEPKQPLYDPLSTPNVNNEESSVESDDGSVGSKQSRKRQSSRITNDKDRVTRDESPDTQERNALAKILFNSSDKKFKRNLDQPPYHSHESKLKCQMILCGYSNN